MYSENVCRHRNLNSIECSVVVCYGNLKKYSSGKVELMRIVAVDFFINLLLFVFELKINKLEEEWNRRVRVKTFRERPQQV